MIKFSVVIPNLNSPTIGQTIESLEKQCFDHDQYEVIVVGMDQPKRVQMSDRVRFDATEKPLYPSAARNRGVAQAQGEILAFIDADCVANPDWLTVLASRFEDPNVSILGGGIAFEHNNYWTLSDNISLFHDYLSSLDPGQRMQLPTLNLAIRRAVFIQAGGFDDRRAIAEDSDLTIRLRRKGYTLYFEPRAVIRHQPTRRRLTDLISHHYRHGKYSIKVDPGYRDEKGLPSLLRTRWGVLLGSPFLAIGVTAKIFASDRALWAYWYTVPAVLTAKLAWCLGAAARPQPSREM